MAQRITPESSHGWIVSVVFWLCLFTAAGLYATVALAPKLLTFDRLQSRYRSNRSQLVALQQQITHLRRVAVALQTDPLFRSEFARVQFRASAPAEQRIPVSADLSLNVLSPAAKTVVTARRFPWYTPVLLGVATSRRTQNWLLAAAAMITVGAFTFLPTGREAIAEPDRPACRLPTE